MGLKNISEDIDSGREMNTTNLLREVLSNDPRVLLAYLVGSRARGEVTKLSDIDVALLVTQEEEAAVVDVKGNLARALSVREEMVDTIDLSRADLHLKRKVLAEGIKLIDRGGFEDAIKKEINEKYPEFRLFHELDVREWLNSPDPTSIDPILVKKRIDVLKEEASFLSEEVLAKPLEEVVSSGALRRLLERSVHVMTEAILDTCRHLVSAKGWGPVETYKDYAGQMAEHGVLSRDMVERFKKHVDWRNVLVHRYLKIDHEKLYKDAGELVSLSKEFEISISRFLGKTSWDKTPKFTRYEKICFV